MIESEEVSSPDQSFLAMKLVEGRSLAELLRRGPLDPRPAAWLIARVARAMDNAHRGGVLHGRLSADNIWLDIEGRPHVAGLELPYRTPEQPAQMARQLNTAVDVRALGAILCECLLGSIGVNSQSPAVLIRQVMEQPTTPPILLPRLDRELAAICLRSLHEEPHQGYPSARVLAEELERWLVIEPFRVRPEGLFARFWRWIRQRPPADVAGASSWKSPHE